MRLGFFVLVFCSSFCFGQTDLRGLEWEDDYYNQLPLKLSYFKSGDEAPPSYSLKNYCPRVITQSSTNTGVAWAAVWYARTILEARTAGWQDPGVITRNAFSPAFNYRMCSAAAGCDHPVRLSAMMASLQGDGALRFADYPEYCSDSLFAKPNVPALKNKMGGSVRLFNTMDSGEIKVRAIKEALAAGHPVVIGIICPPSFSLANDFWQPREDASREFGGHALCVVGYDSKAYGGAFEVVNSWGKTWASQGFTWLRFEEIEKYVLYGFELIQAGPPSGETLNTQVTLSLGDGKPMPAKKRNEGYYTLMKTYRTGAQFQLKLSVSRDLFFYAVAFDEQRNHQVLYPAEKTIYPWLSRSEQNLVLPDASHFITLTDPPGKNYMLLIFAGKEIIKEDLIKQLKEGRGEFGQPLYLTKEKQSTSQWAEDKISFEGMLTNDTLLLLIVEIDQVP